MINYVKISVLIVSIICAGCRESAIDNPTHALVYTEILSVNILNINIRLFITGYDSLTTGYNELYFKVRKDSIEQNTGIVKFYPKMWMTPRLWHSTPVCSTFTYDNSSGYFRGYAIFNMPTSPPILVWSSFITYQDETGINHISDSVPTYTSYHPEKQYKVFIDSTEQAKYYVTMVKPFSPKKGLNDFWLILHQSDEIEQYFQQLNQPQMFISVYELDSLNQSTGNISPVIGNDGIYKGKINLPYEGYWRVNDSIFYHNHFITNNPPPIPQFNFEIN